MRAIYRITKSGLIAAFFLLPALLASAADFPLTVNEVDKLKEQVVTEGIYNLPVWSALLHSKNQHANIADTSFILSHDNFSLASELKKTIEFLYRGDPNNVCRFPARYYWLRSISNIPQLPLDSCPEVIEFRSKAPIDVISIVFASERVSQPASMLGHSFLKLDGKNASGIELRHAITFYTDINTYNLPKLLFDSLVIGKPGFFALSPYDEMQRRYVDEEQRNLWEYELKLTDSQKELIRLHLLELKSTKLTYFFQKYNCATLLNFVISLSGKSMPENAWWLTPKDLMKNAQHAGLIRNTRIVTPSRWLFRSIAALIPVHEQRVIVQQVRQAKVESNYFASGDNMSFMQLELARAYNQYAYHMKELSRDVWATNEKEINAIKEHSFSDMFLTSDENNNPINTPGDRQISLAIQNDKGQNSILLNIIPASHVLLDDNRSYAAETSLQLFAASIKAPLYNEQPSLDRLIFFDMVSLLPHDEFTGGSSSKLHIAIEPQINAQLEKIQAFTINGALGITSRVTPDIDLYSLLGGGMGNASQNWYLFSTIEVGTIIREVWDMKSLISISRTNNQVDLRSNYNTALISHSKFLNSNNTLNLDWRLDLNEYSRRSLLSLTLKNIF